MAISGFIRGCCVLFFYAIATGGLTGTLPIGTLYFLYSQQQLLPILLLYLAWIFIDWSTPQRGGRKLGVDFIGGLFFFRCIRDYYPISLVKTANLDPKRNYIFGYHPHGILPDGLVISFGTKWLEFSEKFPGITPHIGAHSLILRMPLIREVAMWLRTVDVGLDSCRYILKQMGPGNSIALVLGGAAEMVDTFNKDYILTLERRKKFIKMALETGSSLVPVFGFGQHDKFLQPSSINYGWLKSYKSTNRTRLEKWLKIFVTGVLVVFSGNNIPCLPYNKPITVVVGSPIHVQKLASPNDEQIKQLHTQYTEELKRLFEENRNKYGVPTDSKLIIQ